MTKSEVKQKELNPNWKGDEVSYSGLHDWIRVHYVKPAVCERCKKAPPKDLANKSNKYFRDLSDWWYLCRKCHMTIDGRIDKLRTSSRNRKFADKACEHCGKNYHPVRLVSRFCSGKCYHTHRDGRTLEEFKR